MKKILFIDRDGTLVKEPPETFQVDSFDVLEFVPGVFTWLGKIARELDYELVMVTNQDGLGTSSFPETSFWPVQNFIIRAFENEGVTFSEVCIDKSFEKENKSTRKPDTGMLTKYLSETYNLKDSYVIGDRITDIKLANNLGCKSVFLKNYEIPLNETADLVVVSWEEIYNYLKLPLRVSEHARKTNETSIEVKINLDGSGKSNIKTGLSFFDHMLEQLSRHGNIDLEITARGDLHIDEHHTIEDTGITLGEAFAKAIGNKKGMERYGFCLPMDDCLAQVAIDFGGRNWIEWNAEFKREKIGDMPTEMFFHFFKSFSDACKCNLNIKAEGTNEHHKIEAIFKSFAKAIKFALKRDANNNELPSTKGIL
ncbi:MAG: bifunctional histidinol-phosphatase/imidazoleglycerol-phosphate dehydratase HisB [Bacteroidetes bacterium]|nr:bifunctional histidinol-phosphatase/imidazoleglycerol-phosphate dehydratase HisB [Bacteroidota bacterium]